MSSIEPSPEGSTLQSCVGLRPKYIARLKQAPKFRGGSKPKKGTKP
ncbi:hypothetical protein Q31b_13040 [Novipirellula aureliae]|uniref:Uncharacterized protein n=1 Tax=Novipirellula aureliae TaxID=2527966 RepID=A0A5C6E4C4_9BACT|nr:hypothetical protein Q31b_13040 [Novipirellula aureliae]